MEFRLSRSALPASLSLVAFEKLVMYSRSLHTLPLSPRGKAATLEYVCTERCRCRFQVTHKCLTKIFKRNPSDSPKRVCFRCPRVIMKKTRNPCGVYQASFLSLSLSLSPLLILRGLDAHFFFILSRKPNKKRTILSSPSETSGL